VGSIGAIGGDVYFTSSGANAGLRSYDAANALSPVTNTGGLSNGNVNLGWTDSRFKDLYLSGSLSDGTTSRTVADIVGLTSSQFLRSDADDSASGDITFTGSIQIQSGAGSSSPIRIGNGFGSGGSATIHKYNADLYLQYANGQTSTNLYIGGGGTTANLRMQGGYIDGVGTLTAHTIRAGDGNDGYFYSDSNGRTAFTGGQFYIQSSVPYYYNYATNQYHGGTSGDNHYFRGNTLTGNSWSLTGAGAASFASVNINGNLNAVDNIYLAGTLYHEGDTDTFIQFGTDTFYVVAGNNTAITVNTTGVQLGDTGNGYFRPVTGSYGSIEIDGGAHGGWEGYSIGGVAVFMTNNVNSMGLYDDVNNHWALQHTFNGSTQLYYDGASKLDTISTGVSINGNLYTDGSNAEDYDALSGTSVTCNVDNAGAFSLTMTGNTTFTFSGADNNWSMGFILQLTGNGGTVTWPSSVDWAGGTAPDAPASGETDIYVFWSRDGGTTWYGVLSVDAAA